MMDKITKDGDLSVTPMPEVIETLERWIDAGAAYIEAKRIGDWPVLEAARNRLCPPNQDHSISLPDSLHAACMALFTMSLTPDTMPPGNFQRDTDWLARRGPGHPASLVAWAYMYRGVRFVTIHSDIAVWAPDVAKTVLTLARQSIEEERA